MKSVTPVSPEDTRFTYNPPEAQPTTFDAVDIMVLWDDCSKGSPLNIRYESLRHKLSEILGSAISIGTTYLVLEVAVNLINDLKKTHIA